MRTARRAPPGQRRACCASTSRRAWQQCQYPAVGRAARAPGGEPPAVRRGPAAAFGQRVRSRESQANTSMLDLHTADLQVERAIAAKRKRGSIY